MFSRPRILFVDDEQCVLEAMQRKFRRESKLWDMEFFDTAQKALERFADSKVDVIVSDMRMPTLDGAELLALVQNGGTGTVRFLLSGQADDESILRSSIVSHQYFAKPLAAEKLKSAINKALRFKETIPNEEARARIASFSSMPCIEDSIETIAHELKSSTPSRSIICNSLSQNIGMVARLLQFSTNSMFALNYSQGSAETLFGNISNERISSLLSMPRFVTPIRRNSSIYSAASRLNLRALEIANTSTAIARGLFPENEELVLGAYLAGMLRDLGKFLLLCMFGPSYSQTLVESKISKISKVSKALSEQQEALAYGATGRQYAKALLMMWGCSDQITNAITSNRSFRELRDVPNSIEFCVALAAEIVDVAFTNDRCLRVTKMMEEVNAIGLTKNTFGLCERLLSKSDDFVSSEKTCQIHASCS